MTKQLYYIFLFLFPSPKREYYAEYSRKGELQIKKKKTIIIKAIFPDDTRLAFNAESVRKCDLKATETRSFTRNSDSEPGVPVKCVTPRT